jgi:hypothetical protein
VSGATAGPAPAQGAGSAPATAAAPATAIVETPADRVTRIVREHGGEAVLVLVVVLAAALSPGFATGGNITSILVGNAYTSLLALGMTFVIITGGIDLSVGAVLAFAGVVAATLAPHGLLVAAAAGIAAAALLGLGVWLHERQGRTEAARAAVAAFGDLKPPPDGAHVSVQVPDGAAAIAPVVRALDEAGFAVEGIELVRPTLDDVFVQKTGHHLEGDDDATAAAATDAEAAEPEAVA